MKTQTNFDSLVKVSNPKIEDVITLLKSKGFEQMGNTDKIITLIYSKSITYEKKPPFEIKKFIWSDLEQKILREAKIPIPQMREITLKVYCNLSIHATFRNLKRKIQGDIWYETHHLPKIDKKTDMGELAFQLDGMIDVLQDDYRKTEIKMKDDFNKQYDENIEFYLQYQQNSELLKGYLQEYLQSSPEIDIIQNIKFEKQTILDATYPDPSTYKPQYDPTTNTMKIFDGHRSGVFHINSEYSIIKNTLVFFISTWSAKDRYAQRRAQSYFFEPITKQFLTRKSNRIKELGNIDNWKYSYFWSPEQIHEKYQLCFVCGSKLHFPAIPTKVNDVWVYQIKPCCSCFSRMRSDPEFERQAIEKYVQKYQKEFEEEERQQEEKENDKNPLLSI